MSIFGLPKRFQVIPYYMILDSQVFRHSISNNKHDNKFDIINGFNEMKYDFKVDSHIVYELFWYSMITF